MRSGPFLHRRRRLACSMPVLLALLLLVASCAPPASEYAAPAGKTRSSISNEEAEDDLATSGKRKKKVSELKVADASGDEDSAASDNSTDASFEEIAGCVPPENLALAFSADVSDNVVCTSGGVLDDGFDVSQDEQDEQDVEDEDGVASDFDDGEGGSDPCGEGDFSAVPCTPKAATADRDGDGVENPVDKDPDDPQRCADTDDDGCDDCSMGEGKAFPLNDGPDEDSDGICDAGERDDDDDGVMNSHDSAPTDAFACEDRDSDTCDDCHEGHSAPNSDGLDTDSDGLCDAGDPDKDGDGSFDLFDTALLDPLRCQDEDSDTCDECATGLLVKASKDGLDTDQDGLCDDGDSDIDGDTVANADDAAPFDGKVCQDVDNDACDECAIAGGISQPDADGPDADLDGTCDVGDSDDDADGVIDQGDLFPLDKNRCHDSDSDTCDECAQGVLADVSGDGPDANSDGICDAGDADDDGDGVLDAQDQKPKNPLLCHDTDSDGCDECALGNGPVATNADGADQDGDGQCDVTDKDNDNDGVIDSLDTAPANRLVCHDLDNDTCDECATGIVRLSSQDGADTDGDGACNSGDADDDGDAVADGNDAQPLDKTKCRDSDNDTCDDCSSGLASLTNDGTDTDNDGLCDAGDTDDDGDGVGDGSDSKPLDKTKCHDTDGDTCDECATGTVVGVNADGTDTDSDGACDAGDSDDDGDGVADANDAKPLDKTKCKDADSDTCDECSSGTFTSIANDGTDTDNDGMCNQGDTDDDGDGVADTGDSMPLDRFKCKDTDSDTCDECASGVVSVVDDDGPDTDGDGLCDSGDSDIDGDTKPNTSDSHPNDPLLCADADGDTCNECASGVLKDVSNDGSDRDGDGICDKSDNDNDNDGKPDFVAITAGCFNMGGLDTDFPELGPVHRVCITQNFEIMRHEVTAAEYARCTAVGPCPAGNPGNPSNPDQKCTTNAVGKGKHPVNCLPWASANAFCAWIDARLPTEGEWEFAARGTASRPLPWGSGNKDTNANNGDSGINDTWAVCSRPAGNTPEGACDMVGNVWEWCSDYYDSAYYSVSPQDDPENKTPSEYRSIRGNGWRHRLRSEQIGSGARFNATGATLGGPIKATNDTKDYIGFRCAR